MSESEDEGAFESADEEEGKSKQQMEKKDSDQSAKAMPDEEKAKQRDKENVNETDTCTSEPSKLAKDIRKALVMEENKSDSPENLKETLQSPEGETIERGVSKQEMQKESVLNKLSEAAEEQKPDWGWGTIGSWGTSVLSTAQTGVSTFTKSVGEGFHHVLETVETSLVDPSEFDPRNAEEIETDSKDSTSKTEGSDKDPEKSSSGEGELEDVGPGQRETAKAADGGGGGEEGGAEGEERGEGAWGWGWSGLSGLGSAVQKTAQKTAQVVQNTTHVVSEKSQKLMTGSLDVLENIGKKTYNVIAEGDHGLKHTIQKTKDKPNLSQILREAKEDAASRAQHEEEFEEARKAHFGAQFDDFQGLMQLEALEMLSNQCEGKVQGLLTSMSSDKQQTVKTELVAIKDSFELKDFDDEDEELDHDFDRLMADYVGQLGLNTTPERLIQAQEKGRAWLMTCLRDREEGLKKTPKEFHEKGIQTLAEFTACCIGMFHKISQLLLLEKAAPISSFRAKATSLANVTKVLCTEIGILSGKFTQCLNTAADDAAEPDLVNPLITNIYLEATNSSTYIQDAFQLVLPIMQQATLEAYSRQELEAD